MESKPRVETRPPVAIETVVRLLIPPAAREHVLGDLSERYSSPAQYVIDAMRTIPFVVMSQIRRTSEGVVALTRPTSLIRPAGIAGGAVILVALFVLRGKNPGRPPVLEPVYGSAMTLDQLRDEVALYDRTTRRAIAIELAVGYAMLPAFAAFSILGPDMLARVGAGLTVSGIAFVVWYMHRSLRNARWTSTNGAISPR